MKIKRSVLERIVHEEARAYITRLVEAPPAIADAHNDKKTKEKEDGKGEKRKLEPNDKSSPNTAKKPSDDPTGKGLPDKKMAGPAKGSAPGEKDVPGLPDPSDDKLEKDVASPDKDVEDMEASKTDVSDNVTGKTIQSISMDPESKTLPGATEIVLTFNEVPDPLRILVTKTGGVKFFYKTLHNEL